MKRLTREQMQYIKAKEGIKTQRELAEELKCTVKTIQKAQKELNISATRRAWTPSEDRLILEGRLTIEEIMAQTGRTRDSVRNRGRQLNKGKGRTTSPTPKVIREPLAVEKLNATQRRFIRDNRHLSDQRLAFMLSATVQSVKRIRAAVCSSRGTASS